MDIFILGEWSYSKQILMFVFYCICFEFNYQFDRIILC